MMFYNFGFKLLQTFVSILIILTCVFFILKSLPGNSFENEQKLNRLVLEKLQSDKIPDSAFEEYLDTMKNTVTFQWGESPSHPGSLVIDLVAESLIRTLKIISMSFIFILFSSYLILYAIYRSESVFFKKIVLYFNIIFISLPGLFFAPLVIYIFAIRFEWLPVALLDSPAHYILPVLCLSMRPLAVLNRQLILEVDEKKLSDYVRTGIAKGISRHYLVLKYFFRPSLISWISFSTATLIGLISGNFLIEYLFSIPGVGSLFVHSLEQRDLHVLLALIFVFSILISLITQIADYLISFFNPQFDPLTESL